MNKTHPYPIIFFDGYCGLCDRSVQFLMRHDKQQKLRYATLQSTLAQDSLGTDYNTDSFVLYHNGKCYFRSGAAIRALVLLGGFWQLSKILLLVPGFIRDGVYRWIAKNRYRWFGKYETCRIPTEKEKALFVG